MKEWKHFTFDQRKAIASGITHHYKLVEIANTLGVDPTSISKEVKRNRIEIKKHTEKTSCKKTSRWPYVCSGCNKYYMNCPYIKYKYEASAAQSNADYKLVCSRKGLDLTEDELKELDKLIKEGLENNDSIYQIKIKNNDKIKQSVNTLYRYINKGYLTTRRIDLPYAVSYKKRKHNKKYDYQNNKIDRSNHTYLDFLAYIHQKPNTFIWQLDFLGAIKSDTNNILTLIMPYLQLPILEIMNKPNSEKVVEYFDKIESRIGIDAFKTLFPVILTDRDPCFNDFDGICTSKITGKERCKLFYCDPYVSSQKPNIENLNKQLRLYFPKGKSVDKYTQKEIKDINLSLANRPLRSLDGYSSKEAFIKVFDEELFEKII